MTNLQLLEEQILKSWHIIDDINVISQSLESLNKDDIGKVLDGLRILYDCKFEQLFAAYSEVFRDQRKCS